MHKYNYIDKLEHICALCPKTNNLKLCSRCQQVFYCCREHQISDWKIHKLDCKLIARSPYSNSNVAIPPCNMYPIVNHNNTPKTYDVKPPVSYIDIAGSNLINTYTDSLSSSDSLDFLDTSSETDTSIPATSASRVSPTLPRDSDFDQRLLKLTPFPQPPDPSDGQKVALFATEALLRDGYCVLDSVCGQQLSDNILAEVLSLERSGALQPGQLQVNSGKGVNRSIRSDRILWFAGENPRYPAIGKLIKRMDAIVGGLNYNLSGKHVIKGRTKVCTKIQVILTFIQFKCIADNNHIINHN